jgi:REP element-mobilizing transposase RayT
MSRRPRLHCPEAVYDVIWFKIYAYVLMSDHVHLLLATSKTPLSQVHSSRSQVSKELGIQLFAMLVQNGL